MAVLFALIVSTSFFGAYFLAKLFSLIKVPFFDNIFFRWSVTIILFIVIYKLLFAWFPDFGALVFSLVILMFLSVILYAISYNKAHNK
ncbi:hypothetical protein CAP36_11030 [Chitinophagaceae bacterium IBVUCB2]|nr:hypothetical protein CAP36_11030 [Chitinophagaceae bacterium IBVUCB2]